MHIQTHVMTGWCLANGFELTARERLFAILAATAPDVDGLGILVSYDAYTAYHHVLGHNLLFGALLSCALAFFCVHKRKSFWLFLGLFHLHLVLDYFGSGPGWGIFYLWPFSGFELLNPRAWNFFSWQNLCAAAFFLGWTLLIAVRRGRTPLELFMPALDRQLVRALQRLVR